MKYYKEIYNIFFIFNFHLIIEQKYILNKEKIRVRSYGIPNMDSNIFFEMKTKYKGLVGKRRISIPLKEYYKYLETGEYDNNNQIMKEIDYHIKLNKVYPKIFIGYDRKSYKGKDNDKLRITFDCNLRSRRDNLRLENGSNGDLFL